MEALGLAVRHVAHGGGLGLEMWLTDTIGRIVVGSLIPGRSLAAFCAFGIAILTTQSWAANIDVGSGLRVGSSVRSLKDLRDQNVVKTGVRLFLRRGRARDNSSFWVRRGR